MRLVFMKMLYGMYIHPGNVLYCVLFVIGVVGMFENVVGGLIWLFIMFVLYVWTSYGVGCINWKYCEVEK